MDMEFIKSAIERIDKTDQGAIKDLTAIFNMAENKIREIAIETETEVFLLGGIDVNSYGDYWSESGEWADHWSSSSYGC